MRWCITDVSPSAKERGGDNDLHVIPVEDIHDFVERGTVYVYFFENTDDDDFPHVDKHTPIGACQFWEGFLNRIEGSDHPIFNAVHQSFLPFEKQEKMTKGQLIEAMKKVEELCSEK